jgi:hypothetical protein
MKEIINELENSLKNSTEELTTFIKKHGLFIALVLIVLFIFKKSK